LQHPLNVQVFQLQGGLPWTLLGAPPSDPHYRGITVSCIWVRASNYLVPALYTPLAFLLVY